MKEGATHFPKNGGGSQPTNEVGVASTTRSPSALLPILFCGRAPLLKWTTENFSRISSPLFFLLFRGSLLGFPLTTGGKCVFRVLRSAARLRLPLRLPGVHALRGSAAAERRAEAAAGAAGESAQPRPAGAGPAEKPS